MKNWKIVFVAVLVLSAVAVVQAAVVTHTSTTNDVAVLPDNGCVNDTTGNGAGGITNTIPFTETGTISDVDVAVQFTTTWRSDIQAALSYTGGGGTAQIINNWDGSGDNLNAVLDSDSANGLCSAAANCGTTTNCVAPVGPNCVPDATLNAFDTLASPGTWTLAVCDRAAGDAVELDQWSVTLTGDPLPVELQTFTVG